MRIGIMAAAAAMVVAAPVSADTVVFNQTGIVGDSVVIGFNNSLSAGSYRDVLTFNRPGVAALLRHTIELRYSDLCYTSAARDEVFSCGGNEETYYVQAYEFAPLSVSYVIPEDRTQDFDFNPVGEFGGYTAFRYSDFGAFADLIQYDGALAELTYNFTTYAVGGTVPEPATWAMMIGGFGMAGAAMRRRRAVAYA